MFSSMKQTAKRNTAPTEAQIFLNEDEAPKDMNDVLDSSSLRTEFMGFLRRRLANESLLFYESVELYEQLTTAEHRFKAGSKIVEEFVVEESVYWVNLPSTMRVELTATKEFTPETFSSAKMEVFNLMASNFFESFRKHLTGAETEPAPKISFDITTLPFNRSCSFEQLAEALGDNMHFTGENECDCDSAEEEVCCERKRMMIRLEGRKSSSGLTSALLRKVTKGSGSQEGAVETATRKRARLAFARMFGGQRRHSTARRMTFWEEFDVLA